MKESPFGFSYSWTDLRPVRTLVVTGLVSQFGGAVLALAAHPFASLMDSLLFGGALFTGPGFLAGLILQHRAQPGALAENKVMVRRLGLVASAIAAAAIGMWFTKAHR